VGDPVKQGTLTFSGGTLVLSGVPRRALPPGLHALGTWDARLPAWRCDAVHYLQLKLLLDEAGIGREDTVANWQPVHWPQVELHRLRDEQRQAVEAWSAGRRGCVVMPTGTGKTEIALTIMARTQVSTLVVAPVRDLMYQWHRRIVGGLGYDAGVIGDSAYRVRPVSVTTYDSAYLHMDRLGDRFGLLVFDECHHLPGPQRRDAARMSAAPYRLGLTATPERSDGRQVDLNWLIGPPVYNLPLSAVAGRSLADYEVVRIPVYLSDTEQAQYNHLSDVVRRFMQQRRQEVPNYSWQDVCADTARTPQARAALKAYRARQAIEDRAEDKLRVLEDLFRLHAGEPCLVFTGSNAMAREVSRRFLIPCLLSHCGKKERLDVLQGLGDGTYPALVANQVLDEGVDLPEVKVAVVIGGGSSTRQAKQRLGRILRRSGNLRARLYEIVCADTKDVQRSRRRRGTDAYAQTKHQRREAPEC
jgi:superfamily II DNA or RNA helicase